MHARVVLRPVSRPRWGGEPRRPPRRPAQTLASTLGGSCDAQTLPQCGYAMYMIYVSWLRQKTELEKLLMVPNTVREDVAQIESSLALVKLVLNH